MLLEEDYVNSEQNLFPSPEALKTDGAMHFYQKLNQMHLNHDADMLHIF